MSLQQTPFAVFRTTYTKQRSQSIATNGWRTVAAQSVAWRLIVLSAVSPVVNDVLLYRIGNFALTFPHVLIIVATLSVFARKRRHNGTLTLICIVMILTQIYHALVMGFITETEWLKSFLQFVMYIICFIILTSFRIGRDGLFQSSLWISKLGIFIGAIGIVQFVFLQFGVPAYLPDAWRASGKFDPLSATYRYGGFAPAIGLATEPSVFAIGLTITLAILLFLYSARMVVNKKLWGIAVIALLIAVVLSFSLTGIIIANILMFAFLFFVPTARRWIPILALVTIAFSLVGGDIWAPIYHRLLRANQGMDNSSLIRVAGATHLFWAPSTNFATALLGTGLGREQQELDAYRQIYDRVSLIAEDRNAIKIHNLFTVVKVMQGWIGLLLYLALLWTILRPLTRKFRVFIPLFVIAVLLQFASGYFLAPFYWSLLATLAILRKTPLHYV